MVRHRLHVHDPITHGEEDTRWQGLREEVRQVVSGADERHVHLQVLDELANEEVPPSDVFGTLVMLRVVGQIDGRLVVDEQVDGTAIVSAELRGVVARAET